MLHFDFLPDALDEALLSTDRGSHGAFSIVFPPSTVDPLPSNNGGVDLCIEH